MKKKVFIIMLLCLLLTTVPAVAADTKSYGNQVLGYTLEYPADMQVDTSLGSVCTVFRNQECQIEVYYQPLTSCSYASYINYSNGGLLANTTDHQNVTTRKTTLRGYQAQITTWSRPKLQQVEQDKQHYYTVDIRKSSTEAYSIFIKSSRDVSGDSKYMNVVKSFRFTPVRGSYQQPAWQESAQEQQQRISRLNMETRFVLNQYFAPEAPLTWGIFEPVAPADLSRLKKLEQDMGQSYKFLLYYHHLFGKVSIDQVIQQLSNAYNNGYLVELTLQTGNYKKDNAMYDILNGEQDAYLTQYAKAIAAFGHPVLLRFGNEMNGDWCIYSAYHTGKDTEIYRACYRYIHDLFEKNGVNNVLWVWNPNEKSFPDFTWNAMEMYYPGNSYVDLIGLTGYNTGTFYRGESWRDFHTIYRAMYQKYQSQFSQPKLITEFGCSSIGGDKAAWITDMFRQLPAYPAIKVAIWWNGCDWAVPGKVQARPYWVNETPETLASFRAGWNAQVQSQKQKAEAQSNQK